MIRKVLSLSLGLSLGAAFLGASQIASAQQQFNVGDHVTIGSTGESGTVISVGPQMLNGGFQLKVHLDRMGDAFPDVGVPYDSVASRVTPGGGAPGGPQPDPNQPQAMPMPDPNQPQPMPDPNQPQAMPIPQVDPNQTQAVPMNPIIQQQQAAPPRLLTPAPAQQAPQQAPRGQFNVGDRVTIGATGERGTIVSVGQQMVNGGVQLRVHLDKMQGPTNVGVPYDSVASRVTPGG